MKIKKINIVISFLILILIILSACDNKNAFGKIITYNFEDSYGMNFINGVYPNKLEQPILVDILTPKVFLEKAIDNSGDGSDKAYTFVSEGKEYRMFILGLFEVDNTFPHDEEIWIKHVGRVYGIETMSKESEEFLNSHDITIGVSSNNCNYVMYSNNSLSIDGIHTTYFTDIYIKINENYYIYIELHIDSEDYKNINIQDIINSVKIK